LSDKLQSVKFFVGQVSVGQVSVGQVSVGQVSFRQATIGQILVKQVTIGQVSVGQATISQVFVGGWKSVIHKIVAGPVFSLPTKEKASKKRSESKLQKNAFLEEQNTIFPRDAKQFQIRFCDLNFRGGGHGNFC
jgi:hypothetical protein